jgi:hypothetical protein
VILHSNVLVVIMEDWILWRCKSRLVVHPEINNFSLFAKEVTEQPSKPKCLSRSRGSINVLSFTA